MTTQAKAHSIIKSWIQSCIHEQQIFIAQSAVINLYDNIYQASGTPESTELHALCSKRLDEIVNDADAGRTMSEPANIFELDVPGKD